MPGALEGIRVIDFDKTNNGIQILAGLEIGEYERPFAAHFFGVAIHHLERCAHHRCKMRYAPCEILTYVSYRGPARGTFSPRARAMS